jgi:ribosomal protein S12 methylthiotransferase accessory factor
MRSVACAKNPEDAFELERRLDRRAQDDSGRSANLVFAAGAAGNLVGMEVVKELTGVAAASLVGKIAVLDLLEHSIARHVILRQPFCPACSGLHQGENTAAAAAEGEAATNGTPPGFDDRLSDVVSDRVGLIRDLTFPRREASEPNPPSVCLAVLSNFDYRKAEGPERIALGKGSTDAEARTGAICKALERYCACQIDARRLRRAAFGALGEDAIAPPDFVLYSEAQYGTKYFPHRRWSPEDQINWVSGRELPGDVPVLVPATLVYTAMVPEKGEDFVQTALLSGVAAAPDLDTAILHGLFEVIEHDALLIHWMNRLPAPELEYPADCGLAGSIRAHYARHGVELRVFDISTDLAPYVMMAIARDLTGDGPATLVGLGCHLDPGVALLKASMEICQAHPGHVRRYRENAPRERLKSYSDVMFVEDHRQFAAIPENLGEFDFLLKNERREKLSHMPARTVGSARADLERCVATLREAGCRAVYVDMTTGDVGGCGLKVVRTLATGLQPMHFGYAQERLGGRRLFDLPCRMGLASAPRAEAELNPCPHPLG